MPRNSTILMLCSALCLALVPVPLSAGGEGTGADAFRQLGYLLPTPGDTRTASGAPGPGYWQQRVDYAIAVELDDTARRLRGSEEIVYHNLSPHTLRYLWVQLDQNRFRPDSDEMLTARLPPEGLEDFSWRTMTEWLARHDFPGGFDIHEVTAADGSSLEVAVVKTMMRLELPEPLAPGGTFRFRIGWEHAIIDAVATRARGGYELFESDGNAIYEMAQWYPRLAAYTDYQGWQHKQFLGRGEFTLELGDYRVEITVPDDHVVAATGVLRNSDEVLSAVEQERFAAARTADAPVFIVTPEEAQARAAGTPAGTKTWLFEAEDVRDFAWASSRKFIWDAQGHSLPSHTEPVMAMSFYPNEAEPLWSRYSTQAVIHTLNVYSRYTFDYPYPVSISVNGPVGGMEYPMITFNKPRPYPDGTYWDQRQKDGDKTWERSKYGLISVIIHEVGHNYFPMVVNSDERQWTWMDEGLNSFLQFLAEQEWEDGYPSRRGEPRDIVSYMTSDHVVPIMRNSESLLQFGPNAYGKPATALNILRESILGRELFDYAFREYARRWKFKRPTPADFFRSLEDASGIDLDWFWRGWFYGTDHVDIAIESLTRFELDTKNPDIEKPRLRRQAEAEPETRSEERNRDLPKRTDEHPELLDFYNTWDEYEVTPWDYAQYRQFLDTLDAREKAVLETDKLFFVAQLVNVGGLPMPLPLEITYADRTTEERMIPAEIWRWNAQRVSKLFITEKEIVRIVIDPHLETADADLSNNHYPREVTRSRFQLFKQSEDPNPMLRGEKSEQ